MTPFIRVAEVWVPTPDASMLELGGGLYAQAPAFAAASRQRCFGRAEGLPGRAWDEGRPLLLAPLEGSTFLRTQAAQAVGLRCAVALPVFVGEAFKAVLVLLCGDHAEHAGAVELWRNDARVASDMTLVDGYYGSTGQRLQQLSQDTYLPRGTGLPGLAWQRGASVFIDGLGQSRQFLRGDDAALAGMTHGVALPCASRTRETYVLSLLSAARTPLARRIESWGPGDAPGTLQRLRGHCETEGALGPGAQALPLSGGGALARTFATAVPAITEHLADEPAAARPAVPGLTSLVAIPVVTDGAVSEVLALYF